MPKTYLNCNTLLNYLLVIYHSIFIKCREIKNKNFFLNIVKFGTNFYLNILIDNNWLIVTNLMSYYYHSNTNYNKV